MPATPKLKAEAKKVVKPAQLKIKKAPEQAIRFRHGSEKTERLIMNNFPLEPEPLDIGELIPHLQMQNQETFEIELEPVYENSSAVLAETGPVKPEAPDSLAEDAITEFEPKPAEVAEVIEAEPVVYMAELLDLAPERVERLQVAEEPPSLEQIVERATEAQPLEETLLELAVYFDQVELETLEPAEAERIEEIRQILQAIEEYIVSPAYVTATEGKPRITPELTRQLLELLSAVGYKDPGETLIKFVAEHDIYTLIKAIRYLHQLSQASEQQELMARYGLARPAIGDMPGRWGRLLLSLMMGVVLNNQLRQEEA